MDESLPNYSPEDLRIPDDFKISNDPKIVEEAGIEQAEQELPISFYFNPSAVAGKLIEIKESILEVRREIDNPEIKPGAERTSELMDSYDAIKKKRVALINKIVNSLLGIGKTIDDYLPLIDEDIAEKENYVSEMADKESSGGKIEDFEMNEVLLLAREIESLYELYHLIISRDAGDFRTLNQEFGQK